MDNANLAKCYLMDSFEDYVTDCWSYDGRWERCCFVFESLCRDVSFPSSHLYSTLTLLVNIVSLKNTMDPVKIDIVYKSSHSAGFDPFWLLGGFAGRLGRLVKAKELLDDQVLMTYWEKFCTFCTNAVHIVTATLCVQ